MEDHVSQDERFTPPLRCAPSSISNDVVDFRLQNIHCSYRSQFLPWPRLHLAGPSINKLWHAAKGWLE